MCSGNLGLSTVRCETLSASRPFAALGVAVFLLSASMMSNWNIHDHAKEQNASNNEFRKIVFTTVINGSTYTRDGVPSPSAPHVEIRQLPQLFFKDRITGFAGFTGLFDFIILLILIIL